jgi:subtilase family serine protease
LAVTACLIGSWSVVSAQAVRSRIVEEINPNQSVALPGSVSPRIGPRLQIGHMQPSTPIVGITLNFALTAEQKAELDALEKAQLTPGTAEYHQWLTPAEYAARFGMSAGDVQKVEQWLESQGFNIDRVANSRTSITFSGTVEQVEAAFQTQMNQYRVNGKVHWANGSSLSIPAALGGVVQSVGNLNDFRPHPMMRPAPMGMTSTRPAFTSSQSGNHYMSPGDVATIYDLTAAYSGGNTGAGVSIAIMGQSAISASDIEAFESAAGLPAKDPKMILVPDSGTSAVSEGDESESDLDVEYSGAIAKGATIDFVYVGNNPNMSVFDSMNYAVDNDIAPVISISYGACETGLTASDFQSLDQIAQQGAVQGQTIVASSGDDGSTGCYGYTNLTTAQQEAVAANYPASSANVTAVGGTEFSAADVAVGNTTYWQSTNNSDGSSATGWIKDETTWNDDVTCGAAATKASNSAEALCSGGGGVSAFATRPSWQTGVSGLPSGGMRALPDVSLDSSNVNAPYLYCTSDQSSWASGQQASCNSGFRDSSSQDLTAAGGTSFAAPIFAGMMAIIDQATGSSQGVAAAELYKLFGSHASAFHDITTGGNNCTAGSSYCSGAGLNDYMAAAGYDEATGLGSVDFNNLMTAWPAGTTNLLTTTTATAATSSVAAGATDVITITVASSAGTPAGTLEVWDGTTEQTATSVGTPTLTGGAATFTYSPNTQTFSGAHVLEVVYTPGSGTNFAGSSATVDLTVTGGTTPPSFQMAANPTTTTVSQGSSGSSTITVTSQNAYAGTVGFLLYVTSNNISDLANACYALSSSTDANNGTVTVAANGTATTKLTFYTSASACTSGTSGSLRPGFSRFARAGAGSGQAQNGTPFGGALPIGASAMAGLLLFGFRRSRSKVWTMLGCLMLALALGGFATGCGGSSGSGTTKITGGGTSSDVPKGTYTFVLVGVDSSNGAINGQANVTLTVD